MVATGSGMDKQDLFAESALPYIDAIYTASLALTHDTDEAKDLSQETYLRAYRFFHHFTPGTNCRAWLYTILRNVFKTRYRQRQRAEQVLDFDILISEYDKRLVREGEANTANPETAFSTQQFNSEVDAALKVLPREYRAALLLVDVKDMAYHEAAQMLGCPIGTLRSRLFRARRRMQGALKDYIQEKRYFNARKFESHQLMLEVR